MAGFDNLETGLVLLTHPLQGFYRKRNGQIGSYSVWHDRLRPTVGTVVSAIPTLFDRLDLTAENPTVHSVLIQPETEFTIFLPPR